MKHQLFPAVKWTSRLALVPAIALSFTSISPALADDKHLPGDAQQGATFSTFRTGKPAKSMEWMAKCTKQVDLLVKGGRELTVKARVGLVSFWFEDEGAHWTQGQNFPGDSVVVGVSFKAHNNSSRVINASDLLEIVTGDGHVYKDISKPPVSFKPKSYNFYGLSFVMPAREFLEKHPVLRSKTGNLRIPMD